VKKDFRSFKLCTWCLAKFSLSGSKSFLFQVPLSKPSTFLSASSSASVTKWTKIIQLLSFGRGGRRDGG